MKSHPRNEGTSTLDLILLFGMPGVIAVLCVAIAYFGLVSSTT